ncbi:hypothetical protein M3202_19780 [Alkalihalobacillus oceani]|uniref:Uncharacterized protein n=1 Tax=Halalkalibacter oceani TaxID=1653776 RepID=A0A9X2IS94_9BACI|nr:hypothetical protein [Halalkalibacter oceani]MCM3716288.1 hypothetical protein [Halalkalibacter oceani]
MDTNQLQVVSLPIISTDWGEANWNPMVRAYGIKTGRRAKCKSCVFLKKTQGMYTCSLQLPIHHNPDWRACLRYEKKRKKERMLENGKVSI